MHEDFVFWLSADGQNVLFTTITNQSQMKFQHQKTILLVIIGFGLFSSIYYHTDVLDGIRVFMLYNLVPMDVVFDEGIDLTQYDGGVILQCLRDKNFCPEGVHYKDDVTGEVFPSNPDQPKTFQPYVPPADPNAPPHPATIPDGIQQDLNKLDLFAMFMYGLIVVGLVIMMVIVIFLKKKRNA